jgi:hypothetical protein
VTVFMRHGTGRPESDSRHWRATQAPIAVDSRLLREQLLGPDHIRDSGFSIHAASWMANGQY